MRKVGIGMTEWTVCDNRNKMEKGWQNHLDSKYVKCPSYNAESLKTNSNPISFTIHLFSNERWNPSIIFFHSSNTYISFAVQRVNSAKYSWTMPFLFSFGFVYRILLFSSFNMLEKSLGQCRIWQWATKIIRTDVWFSEYFIRCRNQDEKPFGDIKI